MRGKAGYGIIILQGKGITPAYAGKSGNLSRVLFQLRDHPRVCGEKLPGQKVNLTEQGSPPRMRGKGWWYAGTPTACRITPAYAGKREPRNPEGRQQWDHPRVCGEKIHIFNSNAVRPGSPPRMRGKDAVLFYMADPVGITPAYAGKRLKRSHSIGHFSCILCLFHSVLHRASVSGGSRAGPCAPPCLPAQNAVPV